MATHIGLSDATLIEMKNYYLVALELNISNCSSIAKLGQHH